MPVHDGSRSDQDERPGPPGPQRSQRNPEQLVQGSQSMARSLRVQSQQLPTESQVFEDEVLAGTASAEHPTEEMSERHDHSKNLIGTIRIQLFAKSFILQVHDVLARRRLGCPSGLVSRKVRWLWGALRKAILKSSRREARQQARREKDNERESDGHGMVRITFLPLSLSGRAIALRGNLAEDH